MTSNLFALIATGVTLITAPSPFFEGYVPAVPTVTVCRTVNILADNDFVMKAADGGMLEVKAAETALKQTSNKDITSFAQSMMTDHSKANTELLALAKKKGILPPETLSKTNEQKLKDLSTKTGGEFDKAYAEAMVRDHEETVALFKTEVSSGTDQDLKKWAAAKLPVLEHHLMMARDLTKKLTVK